MTDIDSTISERDGWRMRYESLVYRIMADESAQFGDASIKSECEHHTIMSHFNYRPNILSNITSTIGDLFHTVARWATRRAPSKTIEEPSAAYTGQPDVVSRGSCGGSSSGSTGC